MIDSLVGTHLMQPIHRHSIISPQHIPLLLAFSLIFDTIEVTESEILLVSNIPNDMIFGFFYVQN
jgi:hypothetical protein